MIFSPVEVITKFRDLKFKETYFNKKLSSTNLATELALNLLGGQRRLSPKNLHQWPTVTVRNSFLFESYRYLREPRIFLDHLRRAL